MKLQLEIICKNFEQMKIKNNKIYTNEQSEEYYIIPLNKNYDMEYGTEQEEFKLTFTNQLLWLKYSNYQGYILLKEFNFHECVVIKSENIKDIYVHFYTDKDCFRRNVWQSSNNISLNKKYVGKYMLVIPVIEEMVDISEVGVGCVMCSVKVITNEVLLKLVKNRGRNNGYIVLTNNVMLNNEALFVELDSNDVGLFLD